MSEVLTHRNLPSFRELKNAGAVVGVLLSVGAFVRSARTFYSMTFGAWLEHFLSLYEQTITFLFSIFIDWWLPSLLFQMAAMLNWKLELFPQWRDVTALLGLYLAVHVRAALLDNVPNRIVAFSLRLMSAAVALTTSIFIGSFAYSVGLSALIAIYAAIITGIVVYRFGFSLQFALDHVGSDVGFLSTFNRKFADALIIIVFGGTSLAISLWTLQQVGENRQGLVMLISLTALIASLGIYHLVRGAISSRTGSGRGHITIGLYIVFVLVLSLATITQG